MRRDCEKVRAEKTARRADGESQAALASQRSARLLECESAGTGGTGDGEDSCPEHDLGR